MITFMPFENLHTTIFRYGTGMGPRFGLGYGYGSGYKYGSGSGSKRGDGNTYGYNK